MNTPVFLTILLCIFFINIQAQNNTTPDKALFDQVVGEKVIISDLMTDNNKNPVVKIYSKSPQTVTLYVYQISGKAEMAQSFLVTSGLNYNTIDVKLLLPGSYIFQFSALDQNIIRMYTKMPDIY